MRTRAIKSVVLLAAVCLCTGCATTPQRPPRPAAISHVVLIKLNDPADVDKVLAECDAALACIPGVVSYASGKHLDTGRANVDGDYDAGLYIGFESEADYAIYVEHPNHVTLVNKWMPHTQWLHIYDIYDPSP